MAKKKMTKRNADRVLGRLGAFIKNAGKDTTSAVLYALNEALDTLEADDTWGTDGRLDPRGDQRDE